MAGALGLTMGPVIATAIFRYLQYVKTLYAFSVLILITGLISVFALPSRIDENAE